MSLSLLKPPRGKSRPPRPLSLSAVKQRAKLVYFPLTSEIDEAKTTKKKTLTKSGRRRKKKRRKKKPKLRKLKGKTKRKLKKENVAKRLEASGISIKHLVSVNGVPLSNYDDQKQQDDVDNHTPRKLRGLFIPDVSLVLSSTNNSGHNNNNNNDDDDEGDDHDNDDAEYDEFEDDSDDGSCSVDDGREEFERFLKLREREKKQEQAQKRRAAQAVKLPQMSNTSRTSSGRMSSAPASPKSRLSPTMMKKRSVPSEKEQQRQIEAIRRRFEDARRVRH